MYLLSHLLVLLSLSLSLQGSEPLPLVSGRADCSNGFVKGSKAMADTQPKASEMVGEIGKLSHEIIEYQTPPLSPLPISPLPPGGVHPGGSASSHSAAKSEEGGPSRVLHYNTSTPVLQVRK